MAQRCAVIGCGQTHHRRVRDLVWNTLAADDPEADERDEAEMVATA